MIVDTGLCAIPSGVEVLKELKILQFETFNAEIHADYSNLSQMNNLEGLIR